MKIRRKINGRWANTSKMEEVARFTCAVPSYHPRFEDTRLYRDAEGFWYLAGEGGSRSQWACHRHFSPERGRGMKAVSNAQAMSILSEIVRVNDFNSARAKNALERFFSTDLRAGPR